MNESRIQEIRRCFPKSISSRLPKEIGVVEVSSKESQRINGLYRKKDTPTNVLSFRYTSSYGEVILCPNVIKHEAYEAGNSYKYQMTWMVVHGMIHLSDLHHEDSEKAEQKTSEIEEKVLKLLFQKTKK